MLRAEKNAIDGHADGRILALIDVAVTDAARIDHSGVAVDGADALDREVRRYVIQIGQVVCEQFLDLSSVDGGDRKRCVLNGLCAVPGRDDDRFDAAAVAGTLRRRDADCHCECAQRNASHQC
jgi:hypothetical protein